MAVRLLACWSAALAAGAAAQVVPGSVTPLYHQSWQLNQSTAIQYCNSTGRLDPAWAAGWQLVDLDWNGDKGSWSAATPMDCEEDMVANLAQVKAANPQGITWLYRNGIKALPWFTSVREKLEDPAWWGFFMPLANCSSTGKAGGFPDGRCGPNATDNLYHDFEQTPRGDCGAGVECGEYVLNHLNESLREWLLTDYFFNNVTAAGNPVVQGFFVDDDWSMAGPSEMDKDATQRMGMTTDDVAAMVAAWSANRQAWLDKLVAAGKFTWDLFYSSGQTAPGWNQSTPQASCADYMRANCGADSPSQNGTLFFGFSRVSHRQAWPLPSPEQDIAAFLLTRGPYAYIGYGWTGCVDATHPFTRPSLLDADVGEPLGFCAETAPGSNTWAREWTKATVTLNCTSWEASFDYKRPQHWPADGSTY